MDSEPEGEVLTRLDDKNWNPAGSPVVWLMRTHGGAVGFYCPLTSKTAFLDDQSMQKIALQLIERGELLTPKRDAATEGLHPEGGDS